MACGLLLVVMTALPMLAGAESLLQLYDAALETNPTLRGREFGVQQAKAQQEIARSRLLPQLSVSGNHDWNKYTEQGSASERYTGARTYVSARQAVLDLSSYYRLKGAESAVEQSELERTAAELVLAVDVVDRYLAVLQARDELTYLASEKAAIESQMKRLQFMSERKLAKLTDLYEVEAYYQGLLTREIEARNADAVARERLRETTGIAVADVAPLALGDLPAVPGDADQWARDALGRNPVLLAAGKEAESARQLVDSGKAEHLPRISLTASQVYADQGYDNRAVPEYDVGTVGIQFSLPLYEGGRVEATVREATARYRISLEEYERTRRQIELSVRSAYLSAVASYARIGSTGAETRALMKVLEAQQKSYEYRITTMLDLLIAQRRLTRARSDESKARYDFIRDLTVLRAHVGELVRANIEEIDSWMAGER